MQARTFFRIMIDNLLVNNALSKALIAFINFCKEQSYYNKKELKFLNKMPLSSIENTNSYKKRFIFDSKQISGVNYK